MGQDKISFTLEKWTPSCSVVTRGGRPVRIFSTNLKHHTYPVVGAILGDTSDIAACWTKSGLYIHHRTGLNDLFILKES